MATQLYKFGSYTFGGSVGTNVEQLDDEAGQRNPSIDLVSRHGAALLEPPTMAERLVTFRGAITAATKEALRTELDSMLEVIHGAEDKLYLQSDRVFNAYLEECNYDYVGPEQLTVEFELKFVCLDPFEYGLTERTSGWLTRQNYKYIFVTALGNTVMWPVIEVKDRTTLKPIFLKNYSAPGKPIMGYSKGVYQRQLLRFSTSEMTVIGEDIKVYPYPKLYDVTAYMTGSWLPLVQGTNYIRMTGPAECKIRVTWLDRWF